MLICESHFVPIYNMIMAALVEVNARIWPLTSIFILGYFTNIHGGADGARLCCHERSSQARDQVESK